MATENLEFPFDIKGINQEDWTWTNDGTEINFVWNRNEYNRGYTVYIKISKQVFEQSKRSMIKVGLKLDTEAAKYYSVQQRLYRELYGKYGGELGNNGLIISIDDSNDIRSLSEEFEHNPKVCESVLQLVTDITRYIYKYDTIKGIWDSLKKKGGLKNWKVKTCFNTEYSFMGETDLSVEHIEKDEDEEKLGKPYIDLTQFIDDKWKLWFFTRKDADEVYNINTMDIEPKYMNDIIKDLNLGESKRVWRDGNNYVILDEFDNVSDWLCKDQREEFINTVIKSIKHWTGKILTQYVNPQRTK